MGQIYEWKRFWCPRDGKIDLSDDGFLTDPEGEYYEFSGSDVVPFEKISDKACLVLLGEPGIGKSTAIIQEYSEVAQAGDQVLSLNLNEYGVETRLIDEVFKAEAWLKWKDNNYTLHLFLDSLDECQIRIGQVGSILKSRFAAVKEKLQQLRLRIACRTAEWPSVLETALPELWGKDECGVYELAPLRKKDIKTAISANNLDPDEFVKLVIASEVVPLAIKPITLEFLIEEFKDKGKLPSSKIEIYNTGCKKLCEENNPNRRDLINGGHVNTISLDERLAIAKQVAAVSIFCRKPVIYTGTEADITCDEISISEIKTVGSNCTEMGIKEVIGSGLFSGRDAEKFGFAHQTYAEYLAACFVAESVLDATQIESLLFNSVGEDCKVVPQLYEIAGWLGSMKNEVFRVIAENDPQVLLRGDASEYSDEQKEMLVKSILELLSAGRINTREWGLYHTYHKLKHSELSKQLKPFITDKTKFWNARYEAILIARKCELTDLGDVLADVTLDNTDNHTVRSIAAGALAEIGSPECRKRLMPFVLGQGSADPDDQLKGNALRALWPDLIDAKTLFGNLTLPKRTDFSGSYDSFLWFELVKGLKPKDIPYALRWLEGMIGNGRMSFSFERIADDIVILAWKNLDQPEVANAAVDTCAAFFRHHHGILHDSDKLKENEALFDEPNKRRLIIDVIVNRCDDFDKIYFCLGRYESRLVRDGDIDWLLKKHQDADSEEEARRWAKLILYTYRIDNAEHCKKIVEATVSSEILRDTLGFEAVELHSEKASELKKCYDNAKKWMERAREKKEPVRIVPSPAERIRICLEKIEGTEGKDENEGNIDFWYNLCMQLTFDETSEKYERDNVLQLDMTELPGWKNATNDINDRILEAAKKFLEEKSCDPMKWVIKPTRYSTNDIAPNKAFYLLMKAAPEKLDALDSGVCGKWLPSILGISLCGEKEKQIEAYLAKWAYEKCPEQFISVLENQIDGENENAAHISVQEKLELCWNERLCDAIFEKVKQPCIKRGQFNSFKNILGWLVERKHQPTIVYAKSLIGEEWSPKNEEGRKAVDAATVLMKNTDDASWDVIWPAIINNSEYGKELLLEFAHFGSSGQVAIIAKNLDENAIADLYIWLVQQFPYSEDPQYDGAHAVERREEIARFRDELLRVLENMGTVTACEAIEKIVKELPELEWLKSVLVDAKKNTMRKIWQPPTPEQFLSMAIRNGTLLVRDANELQNVVVMSLKRLELEFQGETPTAQFVWDTASNRPKEENAFSDYTKRFLEHDLQDRGIAALREVEIRRGQGNAPGENTDIYITACVPNSLSGQDERITIIVEAKGCWNGQLLTAMETQLAQRYLKDNQCCHGIYLVGWFGCPQCSYKNCRTKICQKKSIAELRTELENQAATLSNDGLKIRSVVVNASLR